MKNSSEVVDTRELILKKLEDEERSLSWLSRKANIPYDTLTSYFTRKLRPVSEKSLIKINAALGTTFEYQPTNQ